MLTVDELRMADELLGQVRELAASVEQAQVYAKERKLTTLDRGWPERVECLSRCLGKLGDVQRDIEGVFS